MIRLFIASDFSLGTRLILPVKQAHYVLHVMRLKQGDQLEVVNGHQGLWLGEIHVAKKQVFLTLIKHLLPAQNLPPCILCPALIKKEAMDFVLQKATELGITEIRPIVAERSVVSSLNLDRSEMIIREACEQCERLDKPCLYAPQSLYEVLTQLQGRATLVWLSERGQSQGQKGTLPSALFVGPEGGWSLKEQELFKKFKAVEWHLGHTILRSETACIAGVTLCLSEN